MPIDDRNYALRDLKENLSEGEADLLQEVALSAFSSPESAATNCDARSLLMKTSFNGLCLRGGSQGPLFKTSLTSFDPIFD